MMLSYSCYLKQRSKNSPSINACQKELLGLGPGYLHRITLLPRDHESTNFKNNYSLLSSQAMTVVSELCRET